MKKIILSIFTLLFITTLPASAALTAKFYGKSYVTIGKEHYVSQPEYGVITQNGFYESLWPTQNAISFFAITPYGSKNPSFWTFAFAAPEGQKLVPGLYQNVVRYGVGLGAKPSMDISGDGRGSNQLGGLFNVLEIGWGADGKVNKAAVDFYHISENNPSWWSQGSVRYNSAIPLGAIPEPGTSSLMILTIGFLLHRRKR